LLEHCDGADVDEIIKQASHFLTEAGVWLARPIAFAFVAAFMALWLIFDYKTLEWHGVLTALMTLFIQRSEHRDTQAMQAKRDELLKTQRDARTDLRTLDEKEPEEVEAFRERQ
jgi:low affinity Fe/Cu permease